MTSVTVTCLLFALVGILFTGLSIPLIQDRVPPNRYYGFRTAKTLNDPGIWYKVNHLSGNDLCLAGVLITISSLMMLVIGQTWRRDYVALTLLLVMVFSLTGVAWHGYLISRRM